MSESFRARREALGLTLQKLADLADFNIRLIQRYEAGDCDIGKMTLRNALRLCEVLHCTPEQLLAMSQCDVVRENKKINIAKHLEKQGYEVVKSWNEQFNHNYSRIILPGGIDVLLTTTTTNKAGGEGLTDVYDRQTVEAVEDFITVVKDASAFMWQTSTDAPENYIRETDARSIAEHSNPDYHLLTK